MPDEISDEDRERLVDAKFTEYFERNWERKFASEFDKRVGEMVAAAKGKRPSEPGSPPVEQGSQRQQKRSSLFEKALGIG
jgi:hypothetical protein